MAEIFAAALKPAEAEELARLSTAALAALKASVQAHLAERSWERFFGTAKIGFAVTRADIAAFTAVQPARSCRLGTSS